MAPIASSPAAATPIVPRAHSTAHSSSTSKTSSSVSPATTGSRGSWVSANAIVACSAPVKRTSKYVTASAIARAGSSALVARTGPQSGTQMGGSAASKRSSVTRSIIESGRVVRSLSPKAAPARHNASPPRTAIRTSQIRPRTRRTMASEKSAAARDLSTITGSRTSVSNSQPSIRPNCSRTLFATKQIAESGRLERGVNAMPRSSRPRAPRRPRSNVSAAIT